MYNGIRCYPGGPRLGPDLAPSDGSVMLGREGRPMTEAEWLATTDPERMLRFLRFGRAGRFTAEFARLFGRRGFGATKLRKFDLLGQACCSRAGSHWVGLDVGGMAAQIPGLE